METIDWTAEFNELTEFEDSQWYNATLEERQEALQELIDTLDVSNVYEGYTFQAVDLPEGDFVAIDAESQTITFDREVLENAELKDCILNDLFVELNVDHQICECFGNLYCSEVPGSYCAEVSEQYSAVSNSSYSAVEDKESPDAIDTPEAGSRKSNISFGGYACGRSCSADGGTSTGGSIFYTLRSN